VFVELMPLLAGRTVLITVAKVDDKTIRVNVIPAQAKADENPALTTPLTYTGPPEEPFVNSTLAQHALALLAWLFRYGEISYHGGFINLGTGATSVLRIDPQCWKRTRRVSK
jgi:hypothetical protein